MCPPYTKFGAGEGCLRDSAVKISGEEMQLLQQQPTGAKGEQTVQNKTMMKNTAYSDERNSKRPQRNGTMRATAAEKDRLMRYARSGSLYKLTG
jgi:hypothetical protein